MKYIPFKKRFLSLIESGQKTATSRMRIYGRPGEVLNIDTGNKIKIIGLTRVSLNHVAYNLFREEGFKTPQGFISAWKKIHPRAGFNGEQKVYFHEFKFIRA